MRSIWWLIAGVMVFAAAVVVVGIAQSVSPRFTGIPFLKSNDPVQEPSAQASAPTPSSRASRYVPILMYHYIRDYQSRTDDPLGIQLSVSPAVFDKQLATLRTAGYETISLEDFINGKLKAKSIILTFDDGYVDHYTEALPILEKYRYTGTFFIVSGFIAHDRYMDALQIKALKDAGMELGGHTITHLNLANASYEKAILEISTSLRQRNSVFAYPSGKYSNETLDIVSGMGIKAAVTTNIGVATDLSSPYELPRIRVKEHTDLLKVINEEIAIAKGTLKPSQRSPN